MARKELVKTRLREVLKNYVLELGVKARIPPVAVTGHGVNFRFRQVIISSIFLECYCADVDVVLFETSKLCEKNRPG